MKKFEKNDNSKYCDNKTVLTTHMPRHFFTTFIIDGKGFSKIYGRFLGLKLIFTSSETQEVRGL